MDFNWLSVAVPAISTIVVALIETNAARSRKKEAERAEVRKKESRLSMEMMSAVCDSVRVITKAVTGQHINGDVEASMKKVDEANKNYNDFLMDVVSKEVTN